MSQKSFSLNIVGATRLVGHELISALAESDFKSVKIRLMDDAEHAGTLLQFRDEPRVVESIDADLFDEQELVIILDRFAEQRAIIESAVKAKCWIIDCSGEYSLNPTIPVLIPGINDHGLTSEFKFVTLPTPITTLLAKVLHPISSRYPVKKAVASVLQGYAAAGSVYLETLLEQTRSLLSFADQDVEAFPYQMAFTALPATREANVPGFLDSSSQIKHELAKILRVPTFDLSVSLTWIPVFMGFGMTLYFEVSEPCTTAELADCLRGCPWLQLIEQPTEADALSMQTAVLAGELRVGNLKADESSPTSYSLWVAGDYMKDGVIDSLLQLIAHYRSFSDKVG